MQIDQLPIEILMKIFSYLQRSDEISLVNKWFYSVACKVFNPNICLKIDYRFFKQEWLPSIRNSTREISKVEIGFFYADDTTVPTIISIIKQFSTSIKYLRFRCAFLKTAELLKILSLVPNVEHLVVNTFRLLDRNKVSQVITSTNKVLDLPKLRKLRCQGCSDEFYVVLNRLPVAVLTEIVIEYLNSDELTILLKRQANLKKLTLLTNYSRDYKTAMIADDIFDHLKLESFTMSHNPNLNNLNIATVLSKQTKLKSLTLLEGRIDAEFLKLAANQFTELETFTVYVPETLPVASIAEISKLKKLKNLWLSYNTNQLESLAKLYCPGITALTIRLENVTLDLIHDVAMSVPNLKVLKVVDRIDHQQIGVIMKSFNFVEVLEIRNYVNFGNLNQLNEVYSFNPRLMELLIDCNVECGTPFVEKLIASYPNLKKLELRLTTTSEFRQILDGFTQLETVKLDVWGDCDTQGTTVDDLNYLKDHKKNLKFITLKDVSEIQITDELKRQLSATFGVVIFDVYERLIMAVDRRTMDSERRDSDEWQHCTNN